MGFLDEVGKVLDEVETHPDRPHYRHRGRSTDVPSLVGNVARRLGQAMVDGRKVLATARTSRLPG